ncbi:hypothetical protein L3i22_098100 [Actinoplanes sp. L3-i22]|nr:hypothetical protein L3i22_098100 [Actinoplanes sp. L3-i22]
MLSPIAVVPPHVGVHAVLSASTNASAKSFCPVLVATSETSTVPLRMSMYGADFSVAGMVIAAADADVDVVGAVVALVSLVSSSPEQPPRRRPEPPPSRRRAVADTDAKRRKAT